MKRVSDSQASKFNKILLKGGLAAASPGMAAVVASFTVPLPLLQEYTGMGSMGVAALGVLFFYAAFLFTRGQRWAGLPAIVCLGGATWGFSVNAARLLSLYYKHNPVVTFNDIIAPLPMISLQLTFMVLSSTLGYIIFKAFRLSRSLSPRPINRLVLGSLGLWLLVIILDCMKQV
ncbi:MAG: hypothetical protein KKE44_16045 [Proteobacteria bacterium]|nr:hypothetical protein [Pseudomonadota bacterium]MBU1584241.1 hypothetical protein [Pseudomonadota bacterium]MBU2451793.1 hypothetical protein [Pseudomonadota bacterium]MBU2627723.1 hypothetical protein [Pseudomonadota bacterium]